MDASLIFVGAEAEITRSAFLGLPTVRKTRKPKPYRHPDLDRSIRRARTRAEALTLGEAAHAGVAVPRVLDVDLAGSTLELEFIEGTSLRQLLEDEPSGAADRCRAFGRLVGRLHCTGLVHGDLTTSNVMERQGTLVLIDFGLAQKSEELEDRGVDLHLVERTFESSHPRIREAKTEFNHGYAETFAGAASILERVAAIKARARYA